MSDTLEAPFVDSPDIDALKAFLAVMTTGLNQIRTIIAGKTAASNRIAGETAASNRVNAMFAASNRIAGATAASNRVNAMFAGETAASNRINPNWINHNRLNPMIAGSNRINPMIAGETAASNRIADEIASSNRFNALFADETAACNFIDPYLINPNWLITGETAASNRISPMIAGETAAFNRIIFKETQYAHVCKVDLPGRRMEEVNIQVRHGKVVISTTINEIMESGSEYNNDKFRLEFSLPENAKVEQAKVSMKNGVLTVTIPKEKVQFPIICDVTEEAIICDDIEEAFTLMDKMSAINHTLWTRVSQQARQIEHLYEQALEAKKTIELGNKELAQAIKRNSCGSTFHLILLVLLAFCLLFCLE